MVEEDDTIMPMKDVTAKPRGMVINWDHSASLGFLAKRAKSQSFTISVAKLLTDDMMPLTIAQARALPCTVLG